MEEVIIGIAVVGFVLLFLWLPIWALVSTRGAKRRISKLETQAEQRERELRFLYERVKALEARPPSAPVVPPSAAAKATAETTTPAEATTPAEVTPSADAALPGSPGDDESPTLLPGAKRPDSEGPTAPVRPAGAPEASPSAAAPPPPSAPPPRPTKPPPPAEPPPRFEERLGFWLTRAGVVLVLLFALYAFKYVVDNDWVGPAGRVMIGATVGLGLIGSAEMLKRRTRQGYAHAIVGVGLACLYISAYASSAFYHLLSTELAFAATAAIVLFGAALAWHHRGEAILVLALLATFLSPILLSTGEDRPLALFSYLFVMSAAMVFIAVRLEMVRALFVAVLGVGIVFAGWYEKFFEVFDLRGQGNFDRPEVELLGAYFDLAKRIVPVVFVGVFSLEWIVAGFGLRGKGRPKSSTALILAGLLLSHVGWAALLYDHPPILGGAMILAGGIAIASLHRAEKTELLLVPMLAAFALLSTIVGKTPSADQLTMMAMLGAWTAIYVFTFLRTASDQHQTIEPQAAIFAAVGLGVFTILAGIVLLGADRAVAFAVVVLVVSLFIAVLAHRAGLVLLAAAGLALSVVMMAIAAEISAQHHAPADLVFVGTVLGWSLVYVGGIAYGIYSGRTLGWPDLLTLSAAGLAGLALSIGATGPEVMTLRALIAAGFGAVFLGVGQLASARPELRPWVSILAAQALGLFAAAVGFGLSGATITIVWSVLALVAALVWAESKDPIFGAALALLASATIFRLLAVDIGEADRMVSEFRWSSGRSGVYRLTPFLNPRSYALIGTGAAFLAAAARLGRAAAQKTLKTGGAMLPAAGALAITAYLLLIGLAVSEVSAAVLELPPPPPMILDLQEFSAFMDTVNQQEALQAGKLAMATTLVIGLAAMALLAIGFSARNAFHRYLGLAVFLGALLKLVTWDVWHIESIYRTIVFGVLGVLLLAGGYLYSRLKNLFTEGRASAALLVAVGLSAFSGGRAHADPPAPGAALHRYETMRAISGLTGSGDARLPIDLELYRQSLAAERLADLRIVGPDGALVPHLVRPVRAPRIPAERAGQIFDPGEIDNGGFRAVFQVPAGDPHCEARLEIEGPTPFLRRTLIETGDSPQLFQTVARGGVVYAMSDGVRATHLRYPTSVARWVRITLLGDREAGTSRISAAHFGCVPPGLKTPVDELSIPIVARQHDAEKKETILELDAGAEGVPLRALMIDTTTPEFVRRVAISASSYKSVWPAVTGGVIHRVAGAEVDPETTWIRIPEVQKRYLRITIEDGDDAPLEITAVRGEVLRQEILFRASKGGAHTLYVGDKNGSAAQYDLAQVLARRTEETPLLEANLGPGAKNPSFGKEVVAANLPFTEQHRGVIGVVLGVVLVALSAWAVRMIRKSPAT